MEQTDNVMIVSGDGHMGAKPETYRDYIDPKFRDRISELQQENDEFLQHTALTRDRWSSDDLDLVDDRGRIRAGGEFGAYDVETRLQELDAEGIAVEVLHGGHQCAILPFFSVMNAPHPAELRDAGARAYHRWMADMISVAPDRLIGIADPGPCLDLDETIRELTWCRENGFRSVSVPQQAWNPDLPPVYDPYYEPFWAACADLGLVLSVHAGWGSPQGKFQEFVKSFVDLVIGADSEKSMKRTNARDAVMEGMAKSEDSPLKLDMGPRRVMWQLMLGGVFDRYPDVHLVLTEIRADWLPSTLAVLDELAGRQPASGDLKPSEYFGRNVFATPSSIHRSEVEMRYEIGVDQLMFGADFPHPEGTWPNTLEWIRAALAGVPESEARAILAENAIRCYGLDRAEVSAVAARIGPSSVDVFGDHHVDPKRIEHFHSRAGYNRPAEVADTELVTTLFEEDRRSVAAPAT